LDGEPVDETILKIAHAAFTTRTVEDTAIMLNVLATRGVSSGAFTADYTAAFGATKVPRLAWLQTLRPRMG
jgi:Asp-tRNA(Asn)/Glu-tRNA(Gln) amidotransferase A subunit family amidase